MFEYSCLHFPTTPFPHHTHPHLPPSILPPNGCPTPALAPLQSVLNRTASVIPLKHKSDHFLPLPKASNATPNSFVGNTQVLVSYRSNGYVPITAISDTKS